MSWQHRRQIEVARVIEEVSVSECLFCHSRNLKRFGVRHNRCGDVQRFICADCHKTFSINIAFEKMQHSPKAITAAMQLYFSGESLRNTQRSLLLLGVQVDHTTAVRWITKYVSLMHGYVEKLRPNVSDTWRTDELFMKFSTKLEYVFTLMDDETRFWIAQQVAENKGTSDVKPMICEGMRITGKNPKTLISDGAPNYIDATRAFSTHGHPITTITRQMQIDQFLPGMGPLSSHPCSSFSTGRSILPDKFDYTSYQLIPLTGVGEMVYSPISFSSPAFSQDSSGPTPLQRY
jgi:transposase-like protein